MLHLRLCKGLSYSGVVKATKQAPDVFTESEEIAAAAVATGYFKLMEGTDTLPPPKAPTGTITKIDTMTVPKLKDYAKAKGIDLGGAALKDVILAVIAKAEAGTGVSEDDEDDTASQFTGGSGEAAGTGAPAEAAGAVGAPGGGGGSSE